MTEKENILESIRNWKVVGEELRAMSGEESARIFHGLQACGQACGDNPNAPKTTAWSNSNGFL